MAVQDIFVPDIGNFDSVDVIEVLIKAGDIIAKDDSLMTVESDKASMDIPAPFAGVVKEVKIKVGDKAAQGTLIMTMDVNDVAAAAPQPVTQAAAPANRRGRGLGWHIRPNAPRPHANLSEQRHHPR